MNVLNPCDVLIVERIHPKHTRALTVQGLKSVVVLERRAPLDLACSQYAIKLPANGVPVKRLSPAVMLLLGYFERKLGSGCIRCSE